MTVKARESEWANTSCCYCYCYCYYCYLTWCVEGWYFSRMRS